MKKPTYTLSIPQPCHERWDEMTPTEKGRFCGSCQKQVVDFSGLSDREVIQLIEQSSGKVCGRLQKNQIDRPMMLEPWAQRASVRFSGFFAGLMLLSSVDYTSAKAIDYRNIELSSIHADARKDIVTDKDHGNDSLASVIKGKILDANSKMPVGQVKVSITVVENQDFKDYNVRESYARAAAIVEAGVRSGSYSESFITDSDGKFSFDIPQHLIEGTAVISISFSGHTESRVLEKRHLRNELVFLIDTMKLEQWNNERMAGELSIIKKMKVPKSDRASKR